MPGGDRTGPWGEGPRTGRAQGFCAGTGMPGSEAAPRGWGRGGGRRRRNCLRATGRPGWSRFDAAPPADGGTGSSRAFLAERARRLGEELAEIQTRLSELEAADRSRSDIGPEGGNTGGTA